MSMSEENGFIIIMSVLIISILGIMVIFGTYHQQNTDFTTNGSGIHILTVTTSDSVIIFDDKLNCLFRGKK